MPAGSLVRSGTTEYGDEVKLPTTVDSMEMVTLGSPAEETAETDMGWLADIEEPAGLMKVTTGLGGVQLTALVASALLPKRSVTVAVMTYEPPGRVVRSGMAENGAVEVETIVVLLSWMVTCGSTV